MAGRIVGEHEKPFVKGSSKPKVEETLETKLCSMITPKLIYKKGNKVLDVVEIRLGRNVKCKPIDIPNIEYNFEFEGDAEIGNEASDGISYTQYGIRGYFLSDDEKEIKSFCNVIQITK
jgi:hypothetical protein